MNRKFTTIGQLVAVTALLLTACGAPAATPAPAATSAPAPTEVPAPTEAPAAMMTVGETAMADSNFSTLVELSVAAGITPTLTGPGPITVFAPTNDAFAKLPKATVDALVADKAALIKVLTYHVLASKVTSADIAGMGGSGSPDTVNGATISVTTKDGSVFVNDAKVIQADIESSNGVIHVIDTVLMPPDMMAGEAMTSTEMMTGTEMMTDTMAMTETMAPADMMSVGETAMANADFSTLVELSIAAGITPVLTGPDAITVFAPTNEAFAKLPKATVDALVADKEALKKVLTYHVLAGKVTSADITGMGGKGSPETMNGAKVNVTTIDGSVYVNDAKVTTADVESTNGVIHIIDTVLIPPDMMEAATVAAVAMAEPQFNTLSQLVTMAGLGDALKDPKATLTVFAPTDEAFAKVPKETMDALAKDPEMLKAVLLYHVLGTKVTSTDIVGMGGSGEPETLNGATISVTTKDGSVFINDAKVITADIATSNGVIHVIDTVLIPPTK